jgi:hypothetical protein
MSLEELSAARQIACLQCRAQADCGRAYFVAARLCLVCSHCQHHCGCGTKQRLENLEPLLALFDEADVPRVVERG